MESNGDQEVKPTREDTLAACSEAVKPYLEAVYEARDLVGIAINRRNRLKDALSALESEASKQDRLVKRLEAANRKVADAKRNLVLAQEAYGDQRWAEKKGEPYPSAAREVQMRRMEDCPERLKPSLQRLFDSMNEAVVWITRRTSLHHRINQLRKGLLEGSCGPREEINRIELEVLENRLSAVVKALERSKANVRQVEEAHTDEILEYRVESFPPEGRDGARRFLLELRDKSLKLREAYDDRRGTLDALQSAVLNLEREIKEAQDHGNEELARSLSMRMATVKAERSQAEEALRDATAKRIRANETYDENVIEYRADTFPPELREKAHAILLEQRHKIAEVHEPHRDLSTMWSNAQLALLKLQREMEVAQDRGDDGLARSLSQQIESMKIEKAVGEEALRQIRIREQEIETEYARKLETLGS